MKRKPLVDVVADGLLDRIVQGEFDLDQQLPTEAEISAQYGVSRVTARESLRTLTAQGILTVKSGLRSVVNPLTQWQSLDAVVRYRGARDDSRVVAIQLLELRRMLETGATGLAATKLSEADLDSLAECIAAMSEAAAVGDVEGFVEADLRFHDVILRGSANIFVPVVLAPLTRILQERRTETSQVPAIQQHAIAAHKEILTALRTRDAAASQQAMERHIDMTLSDLLQHVFGESTV